MARVQENVRDKLAKITDPQEKLVELGILMAERQDWMLAKLDLMLHSLAKIEANTTKPRLSSGV